jgi:hypothetical protein
VVRTYTAFIVVLVMAMGYYAYQRGQMSRYFFHCSRCRTSFPLSPLGASLAPQRYGGSKYGRCPGCGEWSWLDPVPRA